jgi:hypothetical protein
MGFRFSIQAMEIFPLRFLSVERLFEAAFYKGFADIRNGGSVDIESCTNGFTGPVWSSIAAVGFEQDSGSAQFSGRSAAR